MHALHLSPGRRLPLTPESPKADSGMRERKGLCFWPRSAYDLRPLIEPGPSGGPLLSA
jgi:hypothetical protein